MAPCQIVKHATDVGVLTTGATLSDALASLAEGMFRLIVDTNTVQPRETTIVEIDARNMEELAVEWLNELLRRFDAESFLPREYKNTVDETRHSLSAFCQGERFDRDRHFLRTDAKAATYHNLMIQHAGEWEVRVFLDI